MSELKSWIVSAVVFTVFTITALGICILVITGLSLPGCGMEGPKGSEGECTCDPQEFDFYGEYFAECVSMCDNAGKWGDSCGHPKLDQLACVDWLWSIGTADYNCVFSADCYWQMRVNQVCRDVDDDWMPKVWQTGVCPE